MFGLSEKMAEIMKENAQLREKLADFGSKLSNLEVSRRIERDQLIAEKELVLRQHKLELDYLKKMNKLEIDQALVDLKDAMSKDLVQADQLRIQAQTECDTYKYFDNKDDKKKMENNFEMLLEGVVENLKRQGSPVTPQIYTVGTDVKDVTKNKVKE